MATSAPDFHRIKQRRTFFRLFRRRDSYAPGIPPSSHGFCDLLFFFARLRRAPRVTERRGNEFSPQTRTLVHWTLPRLSFAPFNHIRRGERRHQRTLEMNLPRKFDTIGNPLIFSYFLNDLDWILADAGFRNGSLLAFSNRLGGYDIVRVLKTVPSFRYFKNKV